MNEKKTDRCPDFWKRKLIAFLHDPPDKCFDIGKHEESARTFMSGAGFNDAVETSALKSAIKPADHFSSSAERFVFPKVKCATGYDGQPGSCFIHPLSSTEYHAPKNLKAQAGNLNGILKAAVGGIETEDWRKKLFLYWRRWLDNAVTSEEQNAEHLSFSPADSRIPDHSIWNHMAVTSAFAGCLDGGEVKPALLLFQFGPVQEFIAQARSTRDLWSGSYLLSWLMAHAMKAISDSIGPDSIIFPNLRGNGIFDALHKDEMYSVLWDDLHGSKRSSWDRLKDEKGSELSKWLHTPTLPNRFLALAPDAKAVELAGLAEKALREELGNIGEAVWSWIAREADKASCDGVANWKERWDYQIRSFPQVTWAIQPWLGREECLAEFARLPVNDEKRKKKDSSSILPMERLQNMLDFAEKWLPETDRDRRYYNGGDVSKGLNNPGILWSAHYALVEAKLAARRNTRDFPAWSKEEKQKGGIISNGIPKDSLSGKEEVIGDEKFWKHLVGSHGKGKGNIFVAPGHSYGAMNMIKRLWCRTDKVPYLKERTGEMISGFESVEDIAKNNKANFREGKFSGFNNRYVAILAMDGDDMGKWISGEKTPRFLDQISKDARKYLEPILEKNNRKDLRRMLTPSYHMQFSEALANFATSLAGVVVEEHGGQLIYAGGDDVLAMLPADRAIECAEALRAVFRGDPKLCNQSKYHLAIRQSGYVSASAGYPLVVPGGTAEISAGLAIGHCNAPLQMLVKEARKAEKRAKKDYGKGALAISVYKRSGEILECGCKWDDAEGAERVGLKLMKRMTDWSSGENPPVSGRFPYALADLLTAYRLHIKASGSVSDEEMSKIILKEFEHVVGRQAGNLDYESKDELLELAGKWLLQTKDDLDDFVKLFLVETFINRARGEN